jgi:plasmid stabilization system protein ParE
MELKIRFSRKAIYKLDNLLDFLEKEWSIKVKSDFIVRFDKILRKIQQYPNSFPESEKKKGLRKCVVTKQTSIFYSYSDTAIDIIMIFDNRKDPKSLEE